MSDFWNDARTEHLRRLWNEGRAASEIAEIIGGECTRNMVISKTRRVPGCVRRESPIKKRRSLLAYNTRVCEWPYGNGPYTYCGKKTEPGKPYCGFHCTRAYTTLKKFEHNSELGKQQWRRNAQAGKFKVRIQFAPAPHAEDFDESTPISSTNVSPHDEFTKEGTL